MILSRQPGAKFHVPVMPSKVISFLNITPKGIYVDGTIGTGGHATLILKKLSKNGHLVGIDRDEEALKICTNSLSAFTSSISLFNDSYHNLDTILKGLEIKTVNGILLDLGMSSIQLDSESRGFSFNYDSVLDMRFNMSQKTKAYDILNQTSARDLANIIFYNGEEKRSRNIAKKIIEMRPLNRVPDLVEAIRRSTPPNNRHKSIIRVFQAIRIAVNNELENLDRFLALFYQKLSIGGRVVIISFHSLEDRKVKHYLKKLASQNKIKILTKKPLTASHRELTKNSRSKSAKLRAAEKIA